MAAYEDLREDRARVTAERRALHVVADGDLQLRRVKTLKLTGPEIRERRRQKRQEVVPAARVWLDGVEPYALSAFAVGDEKPEKAENAEAGDPEDGLMLFEFSLRDPADPSRLVSAAGIEAIEYVQDRPSGRFSNTWFRLADPLRLHSLRKAEALESLDRQFLQTRSWFGAVIEEIHTSFTRFSDGKGG